MKFLLKITLILLTIVGFTSCSSDNDSDNNQGEAKLSLRLTDAPGDYDAVFIDVREIVIKYDNGNDYALEDVNTGIYDLLELTGGVNILLYNDDVPAGNIKEIRLILGDDNTIVVDGESIHLDTPSAQQSGLKIKLNENLQSGFEYEFLLDFDVDKSIVAKGNGGYNLKPVIRATAMAETGSIAGNVLPENVLTLVTASNGIDEISSFTNSSGEFYLAGVPSGNYTVTIQPDILFGFPIKVVENVSVNVGEISNLGTIDFNF